MVMKRDNISDAKLLPLLAPALFPSMIDIGFSHQNPVPQAMFSINSRVKRSN